MTMDPIKLAVVGALAKQRHKHQDELEAIKATHISEVRQLKKGAGAKPPKRTRVSGRTEVIQAAIRQAMTPDDPHSVLYALRDLARAGTFPQLLGYVPDEGFQWDADPEPKYQRDKYTLEAIRRQLKKRRVKAY